MTTKYVVAVQCDIVKERCSGYLCEYAFHERTGGFSAYPKEDPIRFLSITCGGCCGRATHRKLSNLVKQINAKEGIDTSEIMVHLSSCICKDNFHAPPCPHLDYLKELIQDKLGLTIVCGTKISSLSEKRRGQGRYKC